MVPWRAPQLRLKHRQELSRQAGGRVQGKDMGPPIWTANFRSAPMPRAQSDAVMAGLRRLQGVVNSFYLSPADHHRPASLSSDAPLVGASVTVAAIRADNAALTLTGLPVGLVLRAGDYLSISSTARGREFHQLVTGGTADGTGTAPELEVVPHLRAAAQPGQVVTLLDPLLEMVLDPGALDDPLDGLAHRTIVFSASQVLR